MTEQVPLILPSIIYAAPGVGSRIVFDNIVVDSSRLRFHCECVVGSSDGKRWEFVPQENQADDYPLALIVEDLESGARIQAESVVKVSPINAGSNQTLKLMMVGDSHLHASIYPAEVLQLLSRPGNPKTILLGTHRPTMAPLDVAHEGYGGWTWERFASYYDPGDADAPHRSTSPFMFPDSNGKPALDVARYFEEKCDGEIPDIVTFQLGANDCIHADGSDVSILDQHINKVFEQADILLAQFHRAALRADLGLLLPPPPNARASAFVANYGDTITRPNWLRVRHRLTQRMTEYFGAREDERIFLIPTQASLDPMNDLPEDNGLHPNDDGYRQIGADVYCWIKSRLDNKFRHSASLEKMAHDKR